VLAFSSPELRLPMLLGFFLVRQVKILKPQKEALKYWQENGSVSEAIFVLMGDPWS
jgi:hypothetical protein